MARASTSGSGRKSGRGGRGTPSGVVGFWARPESNRLFLFLGFVIRHRAEVAVLTVGYIVYIQLRGWFTPVPSPSSAGHPAPAPVTGPWSWFTPGEWAWIIMAATLVVVMAVPASRRYTWGRCRAVVVRHRMRACFLQTRTWTTNGRLPFCVWSRPSPVGERVRVWLPAGLSVKHLERIQTELASACWAREARLLPVRSQAALVLVDIVRHDPLGSRHALPPPVVDDVEDVTDDWHGGDRASGNGDSSGAGWSGNSGDAAWSGRSTGSGGSGGAAFPPPPLPPPLPPSGSQNPAGNSAGTGNGTGKGSRVMRKPGTSPSEGGGAEQADRPVTGFGGVDVTDYI